MNNARAASAAILTAALSTAILFGCGAPKPTTYEILGAAGANLVTARQYPTQKKETLQLLGTRPLSAPDFQNQECRRRVARNHLEATAAATIAQAIPDPASIAQGIPDTYLEADRIDIGLTMIAEGYLQADTNYSYARRRLYETETRRAQKRRRGLWALNTCTALSNVYSRTVEDPAAKTT